MKDNKIPIILSSGSLYNYGLARIFALANNSGFEGVEVMVDYRWDTRQVAYLQELSATYLLPILSLHAPFLAHSYQIYGWKDDPVEQLKNTVELAEALGAPVVVAHPPHSWQFRKIGGRLGVSFRLPALRLRPYGRWLKEELAEFQKTTPVIVALENMPMHYLGPLPLKMYQLMDVEDLAQFAHLTFDTTHWGTWNGSVDIMEMYRRFSDKIAHVHLSDYDGREHRLPGTGRLPLDRFLQSLAADRFAGAVSVEVNPGALPAGQSDAALVERLQEACRFCKAHLRATDISHSHFDTQNRERDKRDANK